MNFFDEFKLVTSVLAIENNEPIASDGGVSLVRKFIRAGLYKSEGVLQFIILKILSEQL